MALRSIGAPLRQDTLTICTLLRERARESSLGVALLAVDRSPLTFAALLASISHIGQLLRGTGVTRTDRVAVVLPNGPGMATSFLGVASCAVCAPLNPNYRRPEFEFYLEDLQPKAVIVPRDSDSPAVAVARELGITILRLSSAENSPDGEFRLETEWGAAPQAAKCEPSAPDDVALVLHTSGTTSRPKMVPLTHRNLCHSAANIAETLQLSLADRCLNVMPLFHIHGLVGALLSSLWARASVVCTPGFHGPTFFHWLARFRPTWYTAAPTMHQSIVQRSTQHLEAAAESRLRFIRSCSAPLPPSVLADLENVFRAPVIEAYGMTEASHQIASNPLPPRARKPGSVGVPAGPEVEIVDEHGTVLPAGETGEIVIRGPNVASGCVRNPTIGNSSSATGWYRTGDQGWVDRDGYLYISGRIKEIINRGGEKISPRQVDEVLMEHQGVAHAVAFGMADEHLGEEVAAAVVLRPGACVSEAELQEFAAARLSDSRIPRRIVFLDELPMGETHKPQRVGLAERLNLTAKRSSAGAVAHVPPRTDNEQLLAEVWQEVLRVDRVGVFDNFFDRGGDSILAAQLISRVRTRFGLNLSIVSLFNNPSIAALAAQIAGTAAPTKVPSASAGVYDSSDFVPLSSEQQRMWFLAQYGEGAMGLRPFVVRLRGALNIPVLRRVVAEIVSRHEILRTTYESHGGTWYQRVSGPIDMDIPLLDLRGGDQENAAARAEEFMRSECIRRPDLRSGGTLCATLLRLADCEHVLFMLTRHVACDGWSAGTLIREMAELYQQGTAGHAMELRSRPVQYRNYTQWQQSWIRSDEANAQLAYWKGQLADAPAVFELPTDRPRPAVQSFRGQRESIVLPVQLAQKLKNLCGQHGSTLFMGLLSAYAALLCRYSGETDIPIGSVVANRAAPEVENAVGPFENTVILRADISGDPSFRDLLRRMRQVLLEAFEHQQIPFQNVVEELHPRRTLSHTPLCQVFFELRNLPRYRPSAAGVEFAELDLFAGSVTFDLMFDVSEQPDGLHCHADYRSDLFETETIRRLLGHYQRLVEKAVGSPDLPISRLSILSDAERHRLLVEWNNTRREYPELCMHQLFEEQAAHRPDECAVVFGTKQLSYGELNRRADAVAERLHALGVGPEVKVGLYMERSLEMLVGVLAILKAGGAYLPLDPAYPRARLSYMLEDAGATVLLTERSLAQSLPSHTATVLLLEDRPPTPVARPGRALPHVVPNNLAYTLYTSGSTGKPKGVMVTHSNVVNLLCSMRDTGIMTANDVMLAVSSISFDLATLELFLPLATGGTVVIAPREAATDGVQLADLLASSSATVMDATPTTWRMLVEGGWRDHRLKVLTGGEALPRALADELLNRAGSVWNLYGPTETTIYSTLAQVEPGTAPPDLGRGIANTSLCVLDAYRELVPISVPGELYIAGDGVARGYWNRPELTAEKFLPDPFAQVDRRMYATGDFVRWRSDGTLEFLGRRDNQVKIRGYRVELGEIESALRTQSGVQDAIVVARGSRDDEQQLVAFVIASAARLHQDELRRALLQRLPSYMVPDAVVFLDCFPLLPNGKVDRSSLCAAEPAAISEPRIGRVGPRNEIEGTIATIWAEVLGMDEVDVEDDFFELGGHSVLATRIVVRINNAFGARLRVAQLFALPTIAGLATLVPQFSASPGNHTS